jgi:hypothetical protein
MAGHITVWTLSPKSRKGAVHDLGTEPPNLFVPGTQAACHAGTESLHKYGTAPRQRAQEFAFIRTVEVERDRLLPRIYQREHARVDFASRVTPWWLDLDDPRTQLTQKERRIRARELLAQVKDRCPFQCHQ